jgi:hypothetical protein
VGPRPIDLICGIARTLPFESELPLLESGETVKYVPERLGDTEETVVETYAHVTAKMRSSAVAKVGQFFGLRAAPWTMSTSRAPSVDSRPALAGDLRVTY